MKKKASRRLIAAFTMAAMLVTLKQQRRRLCRTGRESWGSDSSNSGGKDSVKRSDR